MTRYSRVLPIFLEEPYQFCQLYYAFFTLTLAGWLVFCCIYLHYLKNQIEIYELLRVVYLSYFAG